MRPNQTEINQQLDLSFDFFPCPVFLFLSFFFSFNPKSACARAHDFFGSLSFWFFLLLLYLNIFPFFSRCAYTSFLLGYFFKTGRESKREERHRRRPGHHVDKIWLWFSDFSHILYLRKRD